MKLFISTACAAVIALATPALADFERIKTRADFVAAVKGKTLTRPLVKIRLSSGGNITGRGASWDVTGKWTWKGGYLCRNLEWGGDDLGYNCQEIKINGSRMRITSDKGTGDSADFRLR